MEEGVYASPRMKFVRDLIHRVAQRNVPVLMLGETGVGKEVAVRELHRASTRSAKPLRILNCAAISPMLTESVLFGHERGSFTGADRTRAGVFEDANGGTLLLDEIGELSAEAQAALLRVLETRRFCRVGATRETQVDVRLVAATHRNLEAMASAGTFRSDLWHRLNTLTVEIPPLRERREDIAPLATTFLQSESTGAGIASPALTSEALTTLEAYSWPGNVRELRNCIAYAVALLVGNRITPDELPSRVRGFAPATCDSAGAASALSRAERISLLSEAPEGPLQLDLRLHLKQVELELIRSALLRAAGNRREAAASLGLPLRTFERRLNTLHGRAPSSDRL